MEKGAVLIMFLLNDSGGLSNMRMLIFMIIQMAKKLYLGLEKYFQKYNFERRHKGIDYDFPCNRYSSSKNAPTYHEGDLEEKYLTKINYKSA